MQCYLNALSWQVLLITSVVIAFTNWCNDISKHYPGQYCLSLVLSSHLLTVKIVSSAKNGRQIGILTPSVTSSASHFWFPFNNFCMDASIPFKVYRSVKHLKIQVNVECGDHLQNYDGVMALFYLVFFGKGHYEEHT